MTPFSDIPDPDLSLPVDYIRQHGLESIAPGYTGNEWTQYCYIITTSTEWRSSSWNSGSSERGGS